MQLSPLGNLYCHVLTQNFSYTFAKWSPHISAITHNTLHPSKSKGAMF